MHMAAADQSKTPTVRRLSWLYVARCAVACVVTVLAVAVIVRAVVVVLRPKRLQLKLSGGRMIVSPPNNDLLQLRFVLRANNPRASVKFANITVRLTDVMSSSSPKITEFALPHPIAVSQGNTQDATVVVSPEPGVDVPVRYVRAVYKGRGVEGVEIELSGVLVSDVAVVTTSVLATYYCWPVSISMGEAPSSSSSYNSVVTVITDAPCRDLSLR